MLRGERLYEECTGEAREAVNRALMQFDRVLERQDRLEIERARKTLAKVLDEAEFQM